MKNVVKAFGLIALVVVIGFSMAACDDGSGDNGSGDNGGGASNLLLGIWYNPQYQGAIKFLANDIQISQNVYNIQTAIFVNYGTYTVQGNSLTITLTPTYVAEVGIPQETYLFSVNGTSLILSNPNGGYIEGNYTKQ